MSPALESHLEIPLAVRHDAARAASISSSSATGRCGMLRLHSRISSRCWGLKPAHLWVSNTFVTFFNSFYFSQLIGNTLIFSLAKLILGMPVAIILALCIYESAFKRWRALSRPSSYLPHFLSWVIMFGILLVMLSPGEGLINEVIKAGGGKPIAFLTSPHLVPYRGDWLGYLEGNRLEHHHLPGGADGNRPDLVRSRRGGWRLAPAAHLAYFAAWHSASAIVVVTLLRLGNILDAGFHQIFVLYSLPVYSVGDIIDTWVYRQGILEFQFSLATAVGLFKGTIGLVAGACQPTGWPKNSPAQEFIKTGACA